MNGRSRAQGPASTTSPDQSTAGVRHRTEERVLEVLVWHPDVAGAEVIDHVDPDDFRDPVHASIVAHVLDGYRRSDGDTLDPVELLESITARDRWRLSGLDRGRTAAAVWGPRAVADLADLDRREGIRRRLVLAVDDLDRRRPPDRIARRLRRLADQLEEVAS